MSGMPAASVDPLVVLTVGRRLVDDAGAVARGDVVVDEDPPGVLGAPRRGIRVVVEQAVVRDVLQLGADDGLHDRVARGIRAIS